MPVTRLALLAGLALASTLAIAPAHALTMKDCSAKFSAAKEAGTLGDMKWNDFRKTQCGSDADAAAADAAAPDEKAAASNAKAESTTGQMEATSAVNFKQPAAAMVAVPSEVSFPTSVSSKYADETPAKARMHTCLDEYHLNKNNKTLGGLKWVQKGGGYYGLCNTKLKS
ncbi:hypothetical protein SAZ10_23345 [Mesorhizobium sp. BAC0120]|uniref:hypothetical protein n=1 Tax=Mesorhizobium sp. BAC0120 TaxID=3090670 RepID=UPI00298CC6FA|nr:hypothetical protein [Mesorhizobium sp. BAC0120]MDW6024696.1 hypothetical protein [Mesorhizobium sp. BAC0120]